MEHNKRRRGFFWRLPLRRKIGVLALGIVLLMLSTGVVSILLVTRSTHTMQNILNDNQLSYNLQQAVADEAHAFRTLIQAPGVEARQAFEEAAAETARCLAEIPFAGSDRAAELTDILSAPFFNKASTSASRVMPPPTAILTRCTTSTPCRNIFRSTAAS